MAADAWLWENGDRILLEDGTGVLLLEQSFIAQTFEGANDTYISTLPGIVEDGSGFGPVLDANRARPNNPGDGKSDRFTPSPPTRDYKVVADIYFADRATDNAVKIHVRHDLVDIRMWVQYYTASTRWELHDYKNAVADNTLGTYTDIPQPGVTRSVAVTVIGDVANVYIDGILRIGPVTITYGLEAGHVILGTSGGATATTGQHVEDIYAIDLGSIPARLLQARQAVNRASVF